MKPVFIGVVTLVLVAMGAPGTSAADRRPLGEIDFFATKDSILRQSEPRCRSTRVTAFRRPKHVRGPQTAGGRSGQASHRSRTDGRVIHLLRPKQTLHGVHRPAGRVVSAIAFNTAPTTQVRLPKDAAKLSQQMEDAWTNAVMKGHATEDDSQGYTLTNDPKARKVQLAIRDYALQHEDLVLQVLTSSSDAEASRHRRPDVGVWASVRPAGRRLGPCQPRRKWRGSQ
jgi:hypothetical protein